MNVSSQEDDIFGEKHISATMNLLVTGFFCLAQEAYLDKNVYDGMFYSKYTHPVHPKNYK